MHDFLVNINNWFQAMGVQGLALNSCIESFFILPPPDFLLIAMDLAKPEKAMFYAFICTLASAIGGAIGYAIGYWGGRPAFKFMFKKHIDKLDKVEEMYKEYGSFAVFFSAFTPVPYKIFTIGSGILKLNFWKFFSVSLLGRGSRFFLVSLVLMFFGEAVKNHLELIILIVSILILIFCIIVYKKSKKLVKKGDKNGCN
ncbi:MAG: DedA family protein [Cyanobacteria bacterium SIG28]|nr:DedA family protein [Cyanobacteria bacterium SIG28]